MVRSGAQQGLSRDPPPDTLNSIIGAIDVTERLGIGLALGLGGLVGPLAVPPKDQDASHDPLLGDDEADVDGGYPAALVPLSQLVSCSYLSQMRQSACLIHAQISSLDLRHGGNFLTLSSPLQRMSGRRRPCSTAPI